MWLSKLESKTKAPQLADIEYQSLEADTNSESINANNKDFYIFQSHNHENYVSTPVITNDKSNNDTHISY